MNERKYRYHPDNIKWKPSALHLYWNTYSHKHEWKFSMMVNDVDRYTANGNSEIFCYTLF